MKLKQIAAITSKSNLIQIEGSTPKIKANRDMSSCLKRTKEDGSNSQSISQNKPFEQRHVQLKTN